MPYENAEILFASQALLQRLTPGDLDATLDRITRAAVEVLPQVQFASISMRLRDGTLDSYALTDGLIGDLDEQQYQLQEGLCYDAATSDAYVMSGNLAADERYPQYGPVAVRAGIRSQAAIRLFNTPKMAAGLNLYSRHVGALGKVETVSRLFSHQATVALSYSIEIKTLREAVQTRTRIGQAVGIVMERYQMPEQRAFAFLTRVSQDRNVKLRHIADQLIDATAPARPTPAAASA
ncbi:MAG TPA: GAF and ANTAR domain-containing protein [Propionibacteriaceae bacterium]